MENEISIDHMPNVAGLKFRHFVGESDYAAMSDVRMQSRDIDQVDPYSTLESVPTAQDIAAHIHDDHCDPLQDIIIAAINGRVVGYSKVGWWTEKDGIWLYLHLQYLSPEWRNNGIDDAMLLWSEQRIREIAKKHPTQGKTVYGTSATTTEEEKTDLLKRHGYTPAFSMIEMEFTKFDSLEDIRLPEGFVVRPAEKKHIKEIWGLYYQVYINRQYVEVPSDEDYQSFVESSEHNLALWTLAWQNDNLAGYVTAEVNQGIGEISDVIVKEEYRRQGLALALLTKTLLKLKEHDIKIVRLHTNGEKVAGAKSLYEKAGFHLLKTHVRYRKPIEKETI